MVKDALFSRFGMEGQERISTTLMSRDRVDGGKRMFYLFWRCRRVDLITGVQELMVKGSKT